MQFQWGENYINTGMNLFYGKTEILCKSQKSRNPYIRFLIIREFVVENS